MLDLLNFFRIWIPNFPLIAKLLYEATKKCLDEPLFNPFSLANPLCQLTQSILRVPTLHLPDHTRPFFLFAHSNQGHAPGLLCQWARDTWAPIAYLSKQLDMVTKGWPPCIQAMAAIAALVPKANKLSRHAPLTVCSPHTFQDLLSLRAFLSLSPSRVQVLHAFLLDPQLSFSPCSPLNPASLLPTSSTTDPLLHSYSLTVDLTQNPFQNLTDKPILDPDTQHWLTDGSSQKSPHFAAGYAIIQGDLHHNHKTQAIEVSPLPPHTTSQQAELIALTRALTLAKNLRVNIHTDSKYAYNILHSNILIWRERGFLTQKGSPIINSDLIHKLLEAALLPNKAAILYCRRRQWHPAPVLLPGESHGRSKGHQKRSLISAYNNVADQKAKEIALSHPSLQSPVILALIPSDPPTTRKILLSTLTLSSLIQDTPTVPL